MTVRLIHVGVHESLARRRLPGEAAPEWFADQNDHGSFEFQPWAAGQAMASMTARIVGDEHAVKVTIGGLYEFLDEESVPEDADGVRRFYDEHAGELLPFLRQAIYTASSQVWPIKPIMLDVLAGAPGDGEHVDPARVSSPSP